jgi:biopolymer transport protein TolR
VTPLVDVCLVLLIIFMVITPMLGRGVDVKLPKLTQAMQHKEGDQVFVSVNDEGAWIETDLYTEKDLFLARLEEDLKVAAGKAIANDRRRARCCSSRATVETDWGKVKTVMEWITSTNVQIQDIALVVELPDNASSGVMGFRAQADHHPTLIGPSSGPGRRQALNWPQATSDPGPCSPLATLRAARALVFFLYLRANLP